jgi:hypothetical protein
VYISNVVDFNVALLMSPVGSNPGSQHHANHYTAAEYQTDLGLILAVFTNIKNQESYRISQYDNHSAEYRSTVISWNVVYVLCLRQLPVSGIN